MTNPVGMMALVKNFFKSFGLKLKLNFYHVVCAVFVKVNSVHSKDKQ